MLTLSIDGGGIRGIIPAVILDHLEVHSGIPISRAFDHIVGTSTGGILTLGLSKPNSTLTEPEYSAQDMIYFYNTLGQHIFKKSVLRYILSCGGMLIPKYKRTALDDILNSTFGKTKLSQALGNVSIPTYSITNQELVILNSRNARTLGDTCDYYMADLAAATSAAPVYLPPKVIKNIEKTDKYTCADGGLFADNPSLVPLMLRYKYQPKKVVNISIGTGQTRKMRYEVQAGDDGLIGWMGKRRLLANIMDLSSDYANAISQCVYGHHIRLDPIMHKRVKLDDSRPKTVQYLHDVAKRFIEDEYELLESIIDRIKSEGDS